MCTGRMKISSLQKFVLVLTACLFVLSGCGTREEIPCGRAGPMPTVSIIAPVVSNLTTQLSVEMLTKQFPDAAWITPRKIEAELASCHRDGRVLIVPSVEYLPSDWWGAVKAYLDQGGPAVFIGCDPFKARVRFVDGKPREEKYLHDILRRTARNAPDFSSIQGWQHWSSRGTATGGVRAAESPDLPWAGVLVDVKDFDTGDMLVRDGIPHGAIGLSENCLAFHARGSAGTAHLVLECTEEDGSCWVCPITVSDKWQPYILHEAGFRHLYGGKERGATGDHLVLSQAKRMSVGLSQSVAAQAPGDRLFGVSDIRLASDPRATDEIVSWPDIFLMSPSYRYYSFTAEEVECMANRQKLPIGRARIQGPLPRSRGTGGEAGAPYRWIPMFQALSADGTPRCWPASIYIEPMTNGLAKKWAWVGVDVSKPSSEAVAKMTFACAQRMQDGMFLYKAGCPQFSFDPESPIRVSARWIAPAARAAGLRVCAELYKAGDDYLLRRVVGPPPLQDGTVHISLGRAPAVEETAVDYTLRILLEDAGAPGKIIDQIDQPLKFLIVPRTPGEQEWITAAGARFAAGRRPMFMLGVNYWPRTTNGRMPSEHAPHWLDSAVFDPELIREDLAQLEEAGVNVVSIQYQEPEQAPQLKYFLEEARKHGIWVHLFVTGLQPLDQDLGLAERLIDAADLKNESQVFAIDLAWEPRLGPYKSRCRFDADWRSWLSEQYGSIEHAEQVIGCALWRKEGLITGPQDSELAADGESRVAVEAYRRFVNDFMSRRYGHLVRWLRRHNIRQMLGARTGYGGTGQPWPEKMFALDPASGAVHFDFIAPEGWGLNGNPEQFMEAGFITAYCRGVSDGKPVLWIEFGSSVGADPQAADLENQARIYRNMFEMALKSRSAGCVGWWFPSGWRVGEESDMGIVNPDGSWRPVGDVYRDVAHRLRREWNAPQAWRDREMSVGGASIGLSQLWDAWRETYRTELSAGRMEELRPLNFGKRTHEITMRSIGGLPHVALAPLESVNSEWGRVEVDGTERDRIPGGKLAAHLKQKVRLELINTGPATWDASAEGKSRCAWVTLENAQGARQQIPVGVVRFGGSAWITWVASDPGTWRAQPLLSDVGPFGEPLQIEVLDARE
jgi:hypothetical protein